LYLRFIKQHEDEWEAVSIAPYILNLVSRLMSHRGRISDTHEARGWMEPRADLNAMEKRICLDPVEHRNLGDGKRTHRGLNRIPKDASYLQLTT
jgi:hypothetical protein